MPAASKSALGRALTSARRFRATHPVNPSPLRTTSRSICSPSVPLANRQRNESVSSS